MTTKLSDYYIRKNIANRMSKKLCFLHPNMVTLLNLIVGVFIFVNIFKNKPYIVLILLSILNRYLDMMDGEIARSCNKKSKLGAILDISGDILLYLGVFALVLIKTYKKDHELNLKICISLFFIPISIFCLYTVYLELNTKSWINTMNENKSKNILHHMILLYRDNAFIMGILILVFTKFLHNKLM